MKIGIDFDDILLDCNTSLALFHNGRYGTSYSRSEIRSWKLEQTWGCTYDEMVKRVNEWYLSEEHDQSLPMPGSRDVVSILAKTHELHIVTSRPDKVRMKTLAWLDRYFPNVFQGIHFTNHFESNRRSKGHVCKELGISFLVEDSLDHARAVASNGLPVLLLDAPWNQESVNGHIKRIFSWDEVIAFAQDFALPA